MLALILQFTDAFCHLISLQLVAPGEVADVTYQSSFVDILLNWEAPTIAKGTTLTYNVTYIHEGQKITNTVSETTYNLRGLAPNSMIDVIISAVTACGVPGSERKLTIWTKRIREYRNLLYFLARLSNMVKVLFVW